MRVYLYVHILCLSLAPWACPPHDCALKLCSGSEGWIKSRIVTGSVTAKTVCAYVVHFFAMLVYTLAPHMQNVAHDLASLHANYKQLVGGEVGSTWMANQRDRLSSLWSEVASLVAERKCSLEELDGLWRLFNEQKEKVVEFMRTVELHTCLPSVLGRSDVNLSVIDADIQESVVRGIGVCGEPTTCTCTDIHMHMQTHMHSRAHVHAHMHTHTPHTCTHTTHHTHHTHTTRITMNMAP